ncbi:hypothetical protein [Rothia kristinae]|uniref:ATP synthase protein I n=1 Tax=Rothia kristinae TaxID=37923 RepID=A0A7T3F9K7_9MICC|nr:hypothetical protein [Rothia kristinae]QPT53665.1 hypothetical protein I6G21_00080 [Rothia kristinae]
MRAPIWHRTPRQSRTPLADAALAALGDVAAGSLVLAAAGLLLGGSEAAVSALAGGGIVLLAVAASWALVRLVGEQRSRAAAALLIAYPVKVLLAGALLLVVPWPQEGSRGWFLAGAVLGVVLMLAAEVIAVRRLRIPYFAPAGTPRGYRGDPEREGRA